MKRLLIKLLNYSDKLYNWLVFKYRKVHYGNNLEITGRIFCVSNSDSRIKIGNNVKINSCMRSNPIGGDTRTILFAKGNAEISIGDDCGISNATIFAVNSINIGKQVLIGGDTYL